MAKIKIGPALGIDEAKILGKTFEIPTNIGTEIKFENPVEITKSTIGVQKKTAVDDIQLMLSWRKGNKLILMDKEGGKIAGFTDPALDKIYKQKIALITESDLTVALDAYNEFLLTLLEY